MGGPGGGGAVFRVVGRLSALSPARVWIGLKNSDDVGLRLDLLAEVFVDGTKVGEGRLNNVSAGSSGFNNAILNPIPLALTGGPVDFPVVAALEVKVSVRRTCSGGGHASGIARIWYNGQPIDSGAKRDAGSRFDAISDGATTDNFLRWRVRAEQPRREPPGSQSTSAWTRSSRARTAPFKSFGTWSTNP